MSPKSSPTLATTGCAVVGCCETSLYGVGCRARVGCSLLEVTAEDLVLSKGN